MYTFAVFLESPSLYEISISYHAYVVAGSLGAVGGAVRLDTFFLHCRLAAGITYAVACGSERGVVLVSDSVRKADTRQRRIAVVHIPVVRDGFSGLSCLLARADGSGVYAVVVAVAAQSVS